MPEAPSQRRFLVAMMLFVIVVINYLDRSNISIVGPQLSQALNLTPVKLGVVLSGFGWTYVALQIPCGWLVDRVHPRYLYGCILGLWSLATLSLGLATGFMGLMFLRLAVGGFEAPSYPINNRVVTTWFGEDERAGAIAVYTSGQYVGLGFLTPLLSWIELSYGWRTVFAVTGAVGFAWALVWYVLYRDPAEFRGVNQAEIDHIAARGGIPDLSQRIGRQKRTLAWADWKIVLGNRRLWGVYLGQFGINATQWFFLTWFPTYMVTYRHVSFAKSGLLEALPFLGAFAGVLLGGFVSDGLLRKGCSLTVARKVPIIVGMLLSSSIVVANYVSDPLSISVCLTVAFFGCGFGSITWSLVSAMAPERLIGLTSGVFNFAGNLAAVIVPLSIGFLIKGNDFTRPLIAVSAMGLMGAGSYIFLVGKIERASEEADYSSFLRGNQVRRKK
jgi:ACS family D-galactonate transporter-like MFS transporter